MMNPQKLMAPQKLINIPDEVNDKNFPEVMQQAIALELATIPTYLSTYYSINRAQDQDALYATLKAQLATVPGYSDDKVAQLAQELKVDVLVYANKTAALVMSVVIEEMLHLALACNVKQALAGPPDLLTINQILTFPTQLDGHEPEFPINAAKLSLEQLSTFLQIESPQPFTDPADKGKRKNKQDIKYKTIGQMYTDIQEYIQNDYKGTYSKRPQLVSAPEAEARKKPYYSQNSINTVYYDREHKPHFSSHSDSGDLTGVYDAASAISAIEEIMHQGEGNVKDNQTLLQFKDGMPVPLPVKDGKVKFKPGDYDDTDDQELSHFAKFLEAYSLGVHYQKKFADIGGLDDFFSYCVYDQATNPKQVDYQVSGDTALMLCSLLGNAVFTYILLMIEACYYADEDTQFKVFLYGVHKSMIWLLSGVGNHIRNYTYAKGNQQYVGSMTFEYFDFSRDYPLSPKQQLLNLVGQLAQADPTNWGWLTAPEYGSYWPSLPDVRLDHRVATNMPAVPV